MAQKTASTLPDLSLLNYDQKITLRASLSLYQAELDVFGEPDESCIDHCIGLFTWAIDQDDPELARIIRACSELGDRVRESLILALSIQISNGDFIND